MLFLIDFQEFGWFPGAKFGPTINQNQSQIVLNAHQKRIKQKNQHKVTQLLSRNLESRAGRGAPLN